MDIYRIITLVAQHYLTVSAEDMTSDPPSCLHVKPVCKPMGVNFALHTMSTKSMSLVLWCLKKQTDQKAHKCQDLWKCGRTQTQTETEMLKEWSAKDNFIPKKSKKTELAGQGKKLT